MQGNWYKYFLVGLRNYYRFKNLFFLLIKVIFLLKIISICLDIYFGYFPNILKDSIFWFYILKYYNSFFISYIYWKKNFWLIIFCGFICFWFFFRVGVIDLVEVERRLKQKEEDLLRKNDPLKKNSNIINIKQQDFILRRKLKKISKLIDKL